MDELIGLFLRVIFEALFELVVHVIWNGSKRSWWRVRGKTEKRQKSLEAQRLFHEGRMRKAEELRQLRIKRKYRLSDE